MSKKKKKREKKEKILFFAYEPQEHFICLGGEMLMPTLAKRPNNKKKRPNNMIENKGEELA